MSTRAGGGFDSPSAEVPAAAAAFGLLATPARLHIVWALSQGESDASGLTELMGGTFPSASRHLTKPKSAGLVRSRREGRRQVYVVDDLPRGDGRAPDGRPARSMGRKRSRAAPALRDLGAGKQRSRRMRPYRPRVTPPLRRRGASSVGPVGATFGVLLPSLEFMLPAMVLALYAYEQSAARNRFPQNWRCS